MTQKMINPNFHILLDMDGVLADFIGGCAKLFGRDLSDLDTFRVDKYMRISQQRFWEEIDDEWDFWEELERYEWAEGLAETCYEMTGGNLTILTSPALNPRCAQGKMQWIQKHFPGLSRKLLIGPEKHLLAGSNRILIDDSDKNCDAFIKAGGHAILFPQLWNATQREPDFDVVRYVREEIKEIFVQKINEE